RKRRESLVVEDRDVFGSFAVPCLGNLPRNPLAMPRVPSASRRGRPLELLAALALLSLLLLPLSFPQFLLALRACRHASHSISSTCFDGNYRRGSLPTRRIR